MRMPACFVTATVLISVFLHLLVIDSIYFQSLRKKVQ